MMKKGIYPGSFDPITYGHMDVVERATSIFDEIHVAIFDNPNKTPYFSLEERLSLNREVFKKYKNVVVSAFDGLLVDYAMQNQVFTIIRGLRAISDFEYELQIALMNRRLSRKVDTIFFMSNEKNSFLSSNIVRQVSKFKGDISSFVPSVVEEALKKKVQK